MKLCPPPQWIDATISANSRFPCLNRDPNCALCKGYGAKSCAACRLGYKLGYNGRVSRPGIQGIRVQPGAGRARRHAWAGSKPEDLLHLDAPRKLPAALRPLCAVRGQDLPGRGPPVPRVRQAPPAALCGVQAPLQRAPPQRQGAEGSWREGARARHRVGAAWQAAPPATHARAVMAALAAVDARQLHDCWSPPPPAPCSASIGAKAATSRWAQHQAGTANGIRA